MSLIDGCCYQGSYWFNGSYWLSLSHHFEKSYGLHHDLIIRYGISVSQITMNIQLYISSTCCKLLMVISSSSWLITGFVTRLTRRVSLVEQELLTLPEHWSLSPVFSGVRVARSFRVSCVVFCRSLFVLLSLFLCPLCCVSFFELWILITKGNQNPIRIHNSKKDT
jgi:hypothetical protein